MHVSNVMKLCANHTPRFIELMRNTMRFNTYKERAYISGTLKYNVENDDDYHTIQSIKQSYNNTIEYDNVAKRFYIEYDITAYMRGMREDK